MTEPLSCQRVRTERFKGCLLGLALGDALGAPHEGGPLERFVWRLIGTTRQGKMRWTDDTRMSLDVAESLLATGEIDADDLAQRFAASYRWSRGYGPGAARVLKLIKGGLGWREANRSVYPQGSYGNGGAMRVAPIGLFYATNPERLMEAARLTARITHAHPLGEEGAIMMAVAVAHASLGEFRDTILAAVTQCCEQKPFLERLALVREWFEEGEVPIASKVRLHLGNGVAATDSCVTALYCALRYLHAPFLNMQHFIVSLDGDVDSIGAMAGAIWGAANGTDNLPAELLGSLEQCGRLISTAAKLHARCAMES